MEGLNVGGGEILGVIGFLMLIIAFAMEQLLPAKADKKAYGLLNLLGAFIVGVYLWSSASLLLAMLAAIWALLALISIVKK